VARLARIQAASGLAFAFFLLLHLATTTAALGGPAAYDGTLATLRRLYRPTLAIELALVAMPAVIHIACALVVVRERRHRRTAANAPRAHRVAGWFLLAAIAGHVFATRVVPAFGRDGADFSYLAYSLLNWPELMRPYYVLLAVAGAVHLTLGAAIALRIFGVRRTAPGWLPSTTAAALVVAGVIALVLHASAASTARFAEFRALYARFLPVLPTRL